MGDRVDRGPLTVDHIRVAQTESIVPTRVYAIREPQDPEMIDVIVGTFTLGATRFATRLGSRVCYRGLFWYCADVYCTLSLYTEGTQGVEDPVVGSRIYLTKCVSVGCTDILTIKNKYPLTWVDDLFDHFRGATVFSKIDLRFDYYQFKVKKSNILKIAFKTQYGHYEFLIMPFSEPVAFMGLMNRVFPSYLNQFAVSFIAEIFVFSRSEDDHCAYL
ncbi:RNA-directed DNA polymerase-like protein [Gossypium australe]|uniref:RNA-directed DNA polymerase-like protein n=1 Tax=Gossypium australe TaxID=47621 RepID=A0A5B6WQI3_9ROSI|nr:RNA-directed DNA polymerase-like protein [Gossypium australe]